MNAIKVESKTLEVRPAVTLPVTEVKWRTTDDAFGRRLRILVNEAVVLLVEGAEYDALGQWTDDTVKGLVLERLGLTEAAPQS